MIGLVTLEILSGDNWESCQVTIFVKLPGKAFPLHRHLTSTFKLGTPRETTSKARAKSWYACLERG